MELQYKEKVLCKCLYGGLLCNTHTVPLLFSDNLTRFLLTSKTKQIVRIHQVSKPLCLQLSTKILTDKHMNNNSKFSFVPIIFKHLSQLLERYIQCQSRQEDRRNHRWRLCSDHAPMYKVLDLHLPKVQNILETYYRARPK